MELASLKEEVCVGDRLNDSAAPITQLRELELLLVGGGMGDVLQ